MPQFQNIGNFWRGKEVRERVKFEEHVTWTIVSVI